MKSSVPKRMPASSCPIEPLEARIAPAFVSGVVNLADLDGFDGFKLRGLVDNDQLGRSVGDAGDVNGDGFADFIVGAPYANEGSTGAGAAYVVFGRPGGFDGAFELSLLDGTTGFELIGPANSADFGPVAGWSVKGAGDVNGDGFDDVIVGAVGADEGGTDSGAAYVVFGKATGFEPSLDLSTLDGSNGFKLRGVVAADFAGASVSSAGDVNGDGFGDVIVGSYNADEGGSDSGAAYVVFGKANGFAAALDLSSLNGSNGFKLNGLGAGSNLGQSVAAAGDVNGDGFDDVIVGTPGNDATYVVFGRATGFGPTLNVTTLFVSDGFQLTAGPDQKAGFSVSGAGDVNGDGFADLIVGAYLANAGGSFRGTAYIVFGKASGFGTSVTIDAVDGSNGFRVNGAATFDYAGVSVSGAGDVNGDGVADLVVGAKRADGTGAAYVVFGNANGFDANVALSSLDGRNGFKLAGVGGNDYTGQSVSGAGDVNGDGFADVLVGARGANEGGTNRGAAYVVFGGPSGTFINPTIAANGKSATFTDVDGDRVTVKVSKGTLTNDNFKLLEKVGGSGRAQLLELFLPSTFDGADVSVTAKRAGGGDGLVNVGLLNTRSVAQPDGADLGKVTIGGDLSLFSVGDAQPDIGLKSLTVGSLGLYNGLTRDGGGRPAASEVIGGLGALKIAGDLQSSGIDISQTAIADQNGKLGSMTVGGSVGLVRINAVDGIGPVNIGGDLRGLIVTQSFNPNVGIKSVTIRGSVIGGDSEGSGAIGTGILGNVKIGGDLIGGAGDETGFITAKVIGKVTIGGDLLGGGVEGKTATQSGAVISTVGNLAGVTIGGDVRVIGGSAIGIVGASKLGPVLIKGDVVGTAKAPVIIAAGGGLPQPGANVAGIASVTIGGDLEHGILFVGFGTIGQIGAVKVGGDWIASRASAGVLDSGKSLFRLGNGGDALTGAHPSGAVASIKSVTINGAARGTFEEGDRYGIVAEHIGSVKIGGAKLPLTKSQNPNDAANDLTAIHVGATPDFVVREVSRTIPGTPETPVTLPAAGPRTAQPAVVALGALSGTDGFTLNGLADNDRAGVGVGAAGDVNGDGFADLIIGADQTDEGGDDRGAAYVVFGKAGGFDPSVALSSLDGTNGFKISGAANGDKAAFSVSGAGDMNSDGFDDLIIGASRATKAAITVGRPT